MDLDPTEIRVLGCLLEKQRTTPDAYPLSLNALRLACNQATNRDPVVEYDDATVRAALHQLGRRRWTRLASGAGSRAAKYRHLLDDALPLDRAEHAVLCVLMLRGPQTPGELKQRTERMHAFGDLASLRVTLDRLIDRGLVRRLDRRPGRKEERYLQLLGDPDLPEPTRPPGVQAGTGLVLGGGGPPRAGHTQPGQTPPDRYDADLDRREMDRDEADLDRDEADLRRHEADRDEADRDRRVADQPATAAVEAALLAELAGRVARLERDVSALREALGDV